MDADFLEHKLEAWKRWLIFCLGVSAMFLIMAIFDIPNADTNAPVFRNPNAVWNYVPYWYAVWFIWQGIVTPPGFLLLFVKSWRSLPLAKRLNTAFGFLFAAWITFSGFALHANVLSVPGKLDVIAFGIGFVLAASYYWLRRGHLETEKMFP